LTHSVEIKAKKELFKQMNKIIKKESTNKQSTTHSTQTDPTPLLKSLGLDALNLNLALLFVPI
jgi:hypothetical protein